jgi:hypothetical protein
MLTFFVGDKGDMGDSERIGNDCWRTVAPW